MPVAHPGPPPDLADVVVVGGGVVGITAAWHLAGQGLRVVVCEKGRVAAEQSGRNWGWIRKQGRDPAELPLVIEAQAWWEARAQEIGGLGYHREGVLYLARTEAEMARHADWLRVAAAHDLDTRMIGQAEVAARVQGASGWIGALFTPSDARAEPWAAVPLLARAAMERGARVVEGCAVRALDLAGGRVAGVVTEAGRIACGAVIVAAGAWSRLFLGAQGVAIPQLAVLASVGATTPMPEVFAGNAADDRFAFRRRVDGGYSLAPGARHDFWIGRDAVASFPKYLKVLRQDWRATRFRAAAPRGFPDAWGTPRRWTADQVSPFERMRVLNPAPNRGALAAVQDAFAAAFPGVGRPALAASWGGMIDTMPDVVPVIDRAAIPGLVIATGLSGHGFGIGPAVGRVAAALATGGETGHDLRRFRLSRFTDGSAIEIGPGL